MLNQFICRDADKPWSESALRGKYLLRAFGEFTHGLCDGDIFGQVNRHLFQKTSPAKFATGVLAILDPTIGTVRYVNAGHNPPLLVRTSREVVQLEATGFPLAMTPDSEYTAEEIILEPGDLLVLFTDGIVEAQNPEGDEFELDGLVEFLIDEFDSDVHAIRVSLERRLDEFARGVPFGDDRTMILVRRLGV